MFKNATGRGSQIQSILEEEENDNSQFEGRQQYKDKRHVSQVSKDPSFVKYGGNLNDHSDNDRDNSANITPFEEYSSPDLN